MNEKLQKNKKTLREMVSKNFLSRFLFMKLNEIREPKYLQKPKFSFDFLYRISIRKLIFNLRGFVDILLQIFFGS